MKDIVNTWLQKILILIIVVLFLIKISDNVENFIIYNFKEKCWIKFLCILFIIGIIYYLFYTLLWQRCVRYVQKHVYNYFAISMPFII